MISFQSTQFTILISVLCGLVALIIGATWFWNYKAAKQTIASEVEEAKQSLVRLTNAYRKKNREESESLIKEMLAALSLEQENKIKSFEERMNQQNLLSNAELKRVFALHCTSTKSFLTGAQWWFGAAELYRQVETDIDKRDKWVGKSINLALDALENSVSYEGFNADAKVIIESINKSIDRIPAILTNEKNRAQSLRKAVNKKLKMAIKDDAS